MPRHATAPLVAAALAGLLAAGCAHEFGGTTGLVDVERMSEFATIAVGTPDEATPVAGLSMPADPPADAPSFEATPTRPATDTAHRADPWGWEAAESTSLDSNGHPASEPSSREPRRLSEWTPGEVPAPTPLPSRTRAPHAGPIRTVAFVEPAVPSTQQPPQPLPAAPDAVEISRQLPQVADGSLPAESGFSPPKSPSTGRAIDPPAGPDVIPPVASVRVVRAVVHPNDLPRRGAAARPTQPNAALRDLPVPVAVTSDPTREEAPAAPPTIVFPTDLPGRGGAVLPTEPPTQLAPVPQNVGASLTATTEDGPEHANNSNRGTEDALPIVAESPDSTGNEVLAMNESGTESDRANSEGPRLQPLDVTPVPGPDATIGRPGHDPVLNLGTETAEPLPLSTEQPRLVPFERYELDVPFAVDDSTGEETNVLPAAFDLPVPPPLEAVPDHAGGLVPPIGDDFPYTSGAPGCGCGTGLVQPIFGEVCLGEADRCWCGECSPWKKLFAFDVHETNCDIGIGRQRLAFAPFEIESAQPGNNLTLRFDSAYGMDRPDRSEFFWKRQAGTPGVPERDVDYQHFWIVHEIGGGRFSMTTELPFRFLDPVVNENTAGLSDIRLAPKIVLVDGRDWQFTHVFRTYIPSGSPRKGLGTGHASIEPGFLLRFKWTEDTWLHGQLKAWFPLGGDPDFQGPTLIYGFGWGTNLCDTDTFAIIGTMEFTGVSYLDGQSTGPTGILQFTDAETSLNVQPGARFVLGPAGDLGLFELGLSTGHALSIKGQYENQLRLDLRWSY